MNATKSPRNGDAPAREGPILPRVLRFLARVIPTPGGSRLLRLAFLATTAALPLVAATSVFASAAGAANLTKPKPQLKPVVESFVVTPARVPWGGGPVTLKARVAHASRCTFVMHQATSAITRTVACSSGSASARVNAGTNSANSGRSLTFTVTAASGVRKATATRKVVQAPKPLPPLEITSQQELPVGFAGTPYSVSLSATGGTGAYHWTVTGGALPAGLTLSPTGTISGTPSGPDGGTANIQVQDDAGVVAQNSVTVAVAGSAPPVSAPSLGESNNWSGYDVTGGPFTAIAGTFNVPNVPVTSTDTDTSQWVGIDGVSNSDLIQAGVGETVQGGSLSVYAWWEILPAPATLIPTLTIHPNDQVTVAIVRQADGNWLIQIQDLTDQQSWHSTFAYSAPLSSAEWIVEAPTAVADMNVETLGQYAPPVTFKNMSVGGAVSTLEQSVMFDPTYTTAISTPSPLTPAGFTVAYGAAAPSPPG
jgi:Peptidase A4 family/Putative Ig domain